MLTRNTLLCIVALNFTLCVCAQQQLKSSQCNIIGTVVNNENGETEAYATVIIYKGTDKKQVIKKGVTNVDGIFNVAIPKVEGEYMAIITSVGKKAAKKKFSLCKEDSMIRLGTLALATDAKMLKDVVVTGKLSLVTMDVDKLTYDVAFDPDAKKSSTFDMLRKVPFLNINGEDQIEFNGNVKFLVLQNGRKTAVTRNPRLILKSVPATLVKKIEVITSPAARYENEGVGGIINIVTYGPRFLGHLTTLGGGVATTGVFGKLFNTTTIGKISTEIDAQYNYLDSPQGGTNSMRENYESNTQTYLEKDGKEKSCAHKEDYSLYISYDIDKLRLLTLSVKGSATQPKKSNDAATEMWDRTHAETAYSYHRQSTSKHNVFNCRIGLDYQRTSRVKKDRLTTVSYSYNLHPSSVRYHSLYDEITNNLQIDIVDSLGLYNTRSNAHYKNWEHTIQYDYTTPIAKRQTIEVGAKYIWRKSESETNRYESKAQTDDYVLNVQRSNHYRNRNDVLSSYLSYTYRTRKFSFVPSIRYEYTYQKIEYLFGKRGADANFDTHYNNVIPSLRLNAKLSKTQSLKLNYVFRLSRPSISYLNPYFDNTNPLYIRQGNSNLSAERNQVISVNYSTFVRKFNVNTTLTQTFLNDGIMSVSRLIGEDGEYFDNGKNYATPGAMYTTYHNVGRTRKTTLSLYFRWAITKRFSWTNNGNLAYVHTEDPAHQLRNHGWVGNVNTSITWILPKRFILSGRANIQSPNVRLQGRNSGFWSYNMTLQKSMLKNKLFVILVASEPFKKWIYVDNTTVGSNFYNVSHRKYSRQSINLIIQYSFGGFKRSKAKRTKQTIVNDDLKEEEKDEE